MADYLVTAVGKDVDDNITHLLIHKTKGDEVNPGFVVSKAIVISAIRNGHTFTTAKWDYEVSLWDSEEALKVVKRGENEYLRSHQDDTISDNLDNLLPLRNLGLLKTKRSL